MRLTAARFLLYCSACLIIITFHDWNTYARGLETGDTLGFFFFFSHVRHIFDPFPFEQMYNFTTYAMQLNELHEEDKATVWNDGHLVYYIWVQTDLKTFVPSSTSFAGFVIICEVLEKECSSLIKLFFFLFCSYHRQIQG